MRATTAAMRWSIVAGAVLGITLGAWGQGRGGRGRSGRGGRGGNAATTALSITHPSNYNLATVARGKALFATSCASCHGADARGSASTGPDLIRSAMVMDDIGGREIGEFLKYGRPEKSMPAFPALTAAQVSDIAAFLHYHVALAGYRFDYKTLNESTGNAKAGEAFFNGPVGKCSTCHSATGDMKGLAAKNGDDAPSIQNLIVSGGPSFGRGSAGGGQATVTLKSGQTFTGTPVEASDFVVSIRLPDGQTHSWLRSDGWPQYAVHDPLQAHKALALKYTDADIHNLAAYLETLK